LFKTFQERSDSPYEGIPLPYGYGDLNGPQTRIQRLFGGKYDKKIYAYPWNEEEKPIKCENYLLTGEE
jgi:hypothetical protein